MGNADHGAVLDRGVPVEDLLHLVGYTFRPSTMIRSFFRSMILIYPSSSRAAMSPVKSHRP